MKSDTTTTILNFVLAAMVIFGVAFALLSMNRARDLQNAPARIFRDNRGGFPRTGDYDFAQLAKTRFRACEQVVF